MPNIVKNLLFALIALFFVVDNSSAQATEASRGALSIIKEKTVKHTLKNGLRVIMYQRGDAPVFSGVVSVRVGGVDEPEGQTGISHLFEHMAFKGTKEIGTTDYAREKKLLAELEEIAAEYAGDMGRESVPENIKKRWQEINEDLSQIWRSDDLVKSFSIRGAQDLNATTAKELTNYLVSLPTNAFEFWCWMESERLINPILRQFYQERDVVMEERRMRYDDSPDGKLYELLLATAYTVHPYRNPVIGYPHDIMSLTAAQTEEFRKKYYVPSNIVVSIVGDIDPVASLPTIEKYFSRVPVGPPAPRITVVEPPQRGQREVRYNTKASPKTYIAYTKPNYPHPDDAPLGVMAEMLAGTRSSPLYKELVQKKRIVTSIGYDELPGTAYPSLLTFSGAVRSPHNNDVFIAEFDKVLEKFKTSKIDQELLDVAKRSLAMSYLGHLNSSLSIARDFASAELLHGGWEASLNWYDQAMATTPEDIKRVAQKYLVPTQRTIARIEPEVAK